ncbi:MAG TPA: cupin domain-containing protein [Thermomicrobiales bacterium]
MSNDAPQATTTGRAPFAPIWTSREALPSFSVYPGITMWSVTGDKIMLLFVRLEPGAVVPVHHHPNEQAGTVLEGVLRLTIGEETRDLRPGDAYVIPPNVPHTATTDENGCLVIDIFSPPREDYRR